MNVALLNQKDGVYKTTLAPHLAGQSARQGKRITLIGADQQGCDLDWSEQRARGRFDRLFGVIGLVHDTLHREEPELARHSDHIVIDDPPRVAALLRSALAADLALITAQPSPFDGWASADILMLIAEARVFRPTLRARFVLNSCPARTIIARETAEGLAEHNPPALAARIAQRNISAEAAQTSQLVFERDGGSLATREIAAPAFEIERLSPSATVAAEHLHRPAHRRHQAGPSPRASRSPPSSAASPSPTCCAICSRANFPRPIEAAHERRSKRRARATR